MKTTIRPGTPAFAKTLRRGRPFRILLLSDIHYAGEGEQQRRGYESRVVPNAWLRASVRLFRHFVWLREPTAHSHLLDRALGGAGEVDLAVVNGDYSCDSAFIGVADDAAYQSAWLCLEKMRQRYGERFHATLGDHELGKTSLFGSVGGMRLASWRRAQEGLKLEPFWERELGPYVLFGVTSSLIALPVFEPDTIPEERPDWRRLREEHLTRVRLAFARIRADQRVILFCHDPSALPFLWELAEVRAVAGQIERTFIGHLHSDLVLWQSRVLAGLPRITWLGQSVRRMSMALSQAKQWQPFNVQLCRSLAGIQLLKDGGYYILELDLTGRTPLRTQFKPVPWADR